MNDYNRLISEKALEIKAVKLNPEKPFEWASGYSMPIYNDNRMFLFFPEYRKLIVNGLKDIIESYDLEYDVIAGTSTAGIAPGALLAEKLESPFIYIRDKPKNHGLMNQIEGIDAEKSLEERTVLLVEDLISFGGSSMRAIDAIKKADGKIDTCISIFSYGFKEAQELFAQNNCKIISITNYDALLETAHATGYLVKEQYEKLAEWNSAPTEWGEKHGFPKKEHRRLKNGYES